MTHPLKNIQKKTTSPTLQPGDLVMFENEQSALIGVILDHRRERFLVYNERGREVELTPPRLHKIPGSLPHDAQTKELKLKALTAIRSESDRKIGAISIEDLWSVIHESPRDYSEDELYELLFDARTTSDYLALRLALLKDKIFFKRDKQGFSPRTAQIINDLRRAETVRQEKRQLEIETVEFITKRLQDSSVTIPAPLMTVIELLEECAAGSERIDQTRQKEVKEILQLFSDRTKIELRGSLEERAFELLERIGVFHKNTNLVLYRYNPREVFSDEALSEASQLKKDSLLASIPDPYKQVIKDLTALETMTIDDNSTKDMDDALSIEQTHEGYRLGVHISNVALLLPEHGLLDHEAQLRATSIYNSDLTINMLPEALSEDAFSLRAGEIRPAVSCIFELDHRFTITKRELALSLIRVARRLSYDEVDNFLAHEDHDLSLLYNIASHLEQERIEGGAVRVQKGDAIVVIASSGDLSLMEIDEQSPARSLVSEMMVLANSFMAETAHAHNVPLIFRGQPQPDKNRSIDPTIPDGPARDYAIRSMLKKSTITFSPEHHASLGLPAYAQVTSPIRRYADILNQRQLIDHLAKGSARYTQSQLADILEKLDVPLARANQISRETKRFWLLRYLQDSCNSKTTLYGTIIRTDLRNPIVEIEKVYLPVPLRTSKAIKPGDHVALRVLSVQPHSDQIRLEII